MTAVFAFARKEFEDHLRNGWILAISAAFCVFALVIALAGFGFAGALGAADTERTIISLASLVLYLIPLMGLLLGYDGIAGERERSTLELLSSYPVDAWQTVLGKLVGLGAVLAAALLLGLAAPALLAVVRGGTVLPWLAFAAFSIVLGIVFIALALLLSTLARQRGTVLGVALAVWLLLVILFDVGMIGLLVATQGDLPPVLVHALFYLNPASLFRMLNFSVLLGEAGMREMGLAMQAMPPWALAAALAAWCVLPAWLAARKLRQME
jgi:Cu-processing system permease protein